MSLKMTLEVFLSREPAGAVGTGKCGGAVGLHSEGHRMVTWVSKEARKEYISSRGGAAASEARIL